MAAALLLSSMTFVVWDCWLDLVGDALYAFMNALYPDFPDAFSAMNRGFDAEERRTRPEFFLS